MIQKWSKRTYLLSDDLSNKWKSAYYKVDSAMTSHLQMKSSFSSFSADISSSRCSVCSLCSISNPISGKHNPCLLIWNLSLYTFLLNLTTFVLEVSETNWHQNKIWRFYILTISKFTSAHFHEHWGEVFYNRTLLK